jgi:hypothetical protein
MFLAELNGLNTFATDVGSVYLETYTRVHFYVMAGSEFCLLHGHVLIVKKALYGLHSSGAQWAETYAGSLCSTS